MDRASWLRQRRAVLGSSECWQIFIPWLSAKGIAEVDLGAGLAAVAMPLKDSGPHKIWLAKHDEPEADSNDPDDPRNRGHFYEDAVAQIAMAKLGTSGAPVEWRQHPEHPWIGATGDRLLSCGHGLECKYVTYAHNRDIWYQDAAPLFVQLQALWCCEVYDVPVWHIAAEVPGRGHVLYPPVVRELAAEWAERLIAVCGRWWQRHIVDGSIPPIDGTEACYRSIRRQYAHHSSDIRQATADEDALVEGWRDAERARNEAQAELQRAHNRLTKAIGPDLGVRIDGVGKVTWKADTNGRRTLRWHPQRG